MRKDQFINNHLYHIYNRGTDKRNIFLEDADYFRFIHDLYEFNNVSAALHLSRRTNDFHNTGRGFASTNAVRRELLVEIIAFCLMPNHYHLILRQLQDGGIARFMQKFGTGYTMYFNRKNQRAGALFQGIFKSILVDNDKYLLPLANYIHLNPVELIEPKWKEGGIKNPTKALDFLKNYRWSSYPDYLGIKNFPSVIEKELFCGYFRDTAEYQSFIGKQLNKNFAFVDSVTLE